MYKNQYIAFHNNAEPKHLLAEFDCISFDILCIYAHSSLNVSIAKNNTSRIALLGNIINPLKPNESNKVIIENLAKTCSSVEVFLKRIQIFSGRYVLIFKTDYSFIVTGDACHLRQMYFGFIQDALVLTSSPKIFLDFFNTKLQISKIKQKIVELSIYKKNEDAWYGQESIDNRLSKLLPNHYLDVNSRKAKRIPIFPLNEISNESQTINYVSSILKGTYSSLAQRYVLMQALTAGWDSRILLAASKDVKDKIKYYVFDRASVKADDVRIPILLSHRLGLNFSAIESGTLQEDFLSIYKREHLIPRILSKTANIQYHYSCRYDNSVVNVNGNGMEVTRCFYGHTSRKVNLDMLLVFSGYFNKIPYFSKAIEKWYLNASPYAEEYGISLLDLFYWEQRMGNWGAVFPFEQDIAVEEISPFNNRSLLISLLGVSPQKRKSPNYLFFERLIRNLWGDVLTEPINPSEKYIKNAIKGNSIMSYFVLQIKNMIST